MAKRRGVGWLVLGLLTACAPGVDEREPSEGDTDPEPLVPCQPIRFDDLNVEAAVLEAVYPRPEAVDGGYPPGAFDEVTRLRVREATSLEGLQCLGGLEELTVDDSYVDLNDVPVLQTLRSLSIEQGIVVGPWASLRTQLPQLEGLGLDGQYSTWEDADPLDLADLAPWPSLRHVSLRGVDLAQPHLQAVADFPQLQSLSIYGGGLQDVSALSGHPSLEGLALWGHDLGTAPLADMPALSTVELRNAGLLEAPFANLPALAEIDLSGDQVEDIGAIAQLPAVRTLILRDNPVSLGPLMTAASVEMLDVRSCGLQDGDLAPLASTNLRWLDASRNELQYPVGVIAIERLQFLDLSDNPIELGSFLEAAVWPDECAGVLLQGTPLAEYLGDGGSDPGVDYLCGAGAFVEWLPDWYFTGEGSCNGECVPPPPE